MRQKREKKDLLGLEFARNCIFYEAGFLARNPSDNPKP